MLRSRTRASEPVSGSLRKRRLVILSMCGALAATAVVPSASALGDDDHDGPVVSLVGATRAITLTHFPGDEAFVDDLGVYAVTGASTIEIRTKRPDYRTPLGSELLLRSSGRTRSTTLPAGLVKGFDGLDGFTTTTIKNSKGTVVGSTRQTWCPGSFTASRMEPDADATSPYPLFCQGSPWALGTVTGQPAHWASSVNGFSFDGGGDFVTLKDGTYTATIAMAAGWRKVFRTPAAQAKVTVKITVKTVDLPKGGAGGAATASSLRGDGGTAATQAARSQFLRSMPASLVGWGGMS